MWKWVDAASTPRYCSHYVVCLFVHVCVCVCVFCMGASTFPHAPTPQPPHYTQTAGNLSSLFDIGGVLGGIAIGYLADTSGASALVSWGFVLTSVPVLYMYRTYGHVSMTINVILMMSSGFFVNGPYALITTAVSADLVWRVAASCTKCCTCTQPGMSHHGPHHTQGTHDSLQGNEKALATVTAIIDGMGSIGAAVGPMLTGYISELPGGFNNVFAMLYVAALSAALLLSKLVYKEVMDLTRASSSKKKLQRHKAAGR